VEHLNAKSGSQQPLDEISRSEV